MGMIDVDFGDGVIQKMDSSRLEGPLVMNYDTERERTQITEYRLKQHGTVVHRSVHVHLKQGLGIEGHLGGFRG